MKARSALLLAICVVSVAGCVHRPPGDNPIKLDALLAFEDPATCEPSDDHRRLLGFMVAGDANEGFRAGTAVAPPVAKKAFGKIAVTRHGGWWTIGLPVNGTWFGLPLVEIVHSLPEGGDAGDVSYRFAAPVAKLEGVLRQNGFPVKAGQDVPVGPVDLVQMQVGLHPDPDRPQHSLFSCGYL